MGRKNRSWCGVCGKTANPIILVTVQDKTYYFCLKHAFIFLDELEKELRGFFSYRLAKRTLRRRGRRIRLRENTGKN